MIWFFFWGGGGGGGRGYLQYVVPEFEIIVYNLSAILHLYLRKTNIKKCTYMLHSVLVGE